MTGNDDAIILRGVSKSYDIFSDTGNRFFHRKHLTEKKEVLSDINLTIKRGEVLSIIGRNGSGKSTLMKIIAGIIKPTDGTVEVKGKVMGIMETGLPFQFGLPGIENIYLRGMFYGLSRTEIDSKIDEIIEFTELGDAIYVPMKTYSTGMISRLAFSIMIHIDSDIYVFDEALHTGDEIFNRKAVGYIHSLSKKGKTVILTSHSQSNLRAALGKAILLRDGKMVMEGPWESVLNEYKWGEYRDEGSLRNLALAGDPEGMFISYKTGLCKDESERLEFLRAAADNDYLPAIFDYADIEFDKGNTELSSKLYDTLIDDKVEPYMLRYALFKSGYDNERILKMFKEMAMVGDHFDEYRYAEICRIFSMGSESSKKVYDLYSNAYKHGNLDAGYKVALLTLKGQGTYMDVPKALEILVDLAEKGHPDSCSMISRIYFEGKYVKSDMEHVFKWCLAAARTGDMLSQFRVMVMYSKGIGTDVNEEEAKKWAETFIKNRMSNTLMNTASTLEYSDYRFGMDEEDLYRIGMEGYNERATRFYLRMLFRSNSEKDRKKAFDAIQKYCTTSSNAIYPGRFHGDHSSPDFNDTESFRLTKIAADSGNEEAMYILANMYAGGFGTEKNRSKSDRAMRSAARRKSQDAMRIIDKDGQTVKKCMNRVYKTSSRKYKEHTVSIVKKD